jgi:hypothetical protein
MTMENTVYMYIYCTKKQNDFSSPQEDEALLHEMQNGVTIF